MPSSPVPLPASPAQQASQRAVAELAGARHDLDRLHELLGVRDAERRGACREPLGQTSDRAPEADWAEFRAGTLIAAAAGAQPLTPARAEREASALAWTAALKLVGAAAAVVLAVVLIVAFVAGAGA